MDAFERVLMTIITTLNVFRIFLASTVDETVTIVSVSVCDRSNNSQKKYLSESAKVNAIENYT
jgi:hypothetical protein